MAIASTMRVDEMRTLLDRGESDDVIEHLEDLIRREPLYGPGVVMLAHAYEVGDYDALTVQRAWARAVQVVPGSRAARDGLRRCIAGSPEVESESVKVGSSASKARLELDDLDSLINELETARIEPSTDVDDIPEPDLDHDLDDMVSPTLARIYAAQEQFAESARVYRKLADQDPSGAQQYRSKASEMDRKAAEKSDEAAT